MRRPAADVGPQVRESGLDQAHPMDALRARDTLALTQACEGGAVFGGPRRLVRAGPLASPGSDGCTILGRRVRRHKSIWAGVEKRETRGAQNAVPARACGFKSRPRYQSSHPFLDKPGCRPVPWSLRGAVAQLGEHKAGSLGVRGSNPLSSTRSRDGVAEDRSPVVFWLPALPDVSIPLPHREAADVTTAETSDWHWPHPRSRRAPGPAGRVSSSDVIN